MSTHYAQVYPQVVWIVGRCREIVGFSVNIIHGNAIHRVSQPNFSVEKVIRREAMHQTAFHAACLALLFVTG